MDWHLDLVIQGLIDDQVGHLLDEIIREIERRGASAAGGIHPFGDANEQEECQVCIKSYRES